MSENPFDEIRIAVSKAKSQLNAADIVANDMAALLAGRLRKVDCHSLVRLKRELRSFNSNTRRWKENS